MTGTTLVRMWKRVRGLAPVESVEVLKLDAAGAKSLAGSPVLADIRELEFCMLYGPVASLRRLLASEHAANLRRLILPSGTGDDAVAAVVASRTLSRLEWLDLGHGYNMTGEVGRSLLAAEHLPRLRGVDWPHGLKVPPATRAALKKRFPASVW
jgi:hypothetical protein